jgi:hypothetical protein
MASKKTTQLITIVLAIGSVMLLGALLISLTAAMSGDLGQVHHMAGPSITPTGGIR